jgi:hypothetical protein
VLRERKLVRLHQLRQFGCVRVRFKGKVVYRSETADSMNRTRQIHLCFGCDLIRQFRDTVRDTIMPALFPLLRAPLHPSVEAAEPVAVIQKIPAFPSGVLPQRLTMNIPGAPMMPMNPYAQQAWQGNTVLGKHKIG